LTSDVHVVAGAKRHKSLLQGFRCCPRHLPIAGSRKTNCLEPWAHDIQTDIHTEVLPRLGMRQRTTDYRLLLLMDGDQLVAVAGHELVPDAQMQSRYIDFIAVHDDMRGKQLSDGRRCSDAALSMVLGDIAARTPLATMATSSVHHENAPSIRFLVRSNALIGIEVVENHRPVVLMLYAR
jgi:hypothetical protein